MTQTIGQQLRLVREERNLTIEKVAQSTRIRTQFIEAIEADEFESLPSPVQARAFLRIYAEFLELSLDELIAHQRKDIGDLPAPLSESDSAPFQEKRPISVEPAMSLPETPSQSAQSTPETFLTKLKAIFRHIKQGIQRSKGIPPLGEPEREVPPSESESASNIAGESVDVNNIEDSSPPTPTSLIPKEQAKSQVIFSTIGEALRKRRETLSLTFEEIERHTHVRAHYLQELENGRFDSLPSSVQARGMLNNYAHFLDMDVDDLLMQFAEGLQIRRLERQSKPAEESQNPSPKRSFKIHMPFNLRRYLSMDILVGGGLILLLIVFAIWGTNRVIGLHTALTPRPTAPSISDILIASTAVVLTAPSPTNEVGGGTVTPASNETPLVTIPANGPGVVHVVVVALESAWVRVVVDGKIQFEGRTTPGAATPYDGNTQIEVLTGDGAATSILYNQSDLGPMGTLGEVVDHIYTANAILNPTPTFSPTPTITPKPSITPRPSPTLRPSITPRFSPTPPH